MGSYILHPAPSSVASPCRMCTPNRPGRLGWHPLQLAKLPWGVSVSSVSGWVAGRRLECSDEHLAKRSARQFFDILWQFPTILRHACLFVQVTEFVINRHKSVIKCQQFPTFLRQFTTTKYDRILAVPFLASPFDFADSSVEPKVRLQGYGYNLFCSHSSLCLEVLV